MTVSDGSETVNVFDELNIVIKASSVQEIMVEDCKPRLGYLLSRHQDPPKAQCQLCSNWFMVI